MQLLSCTCENEDDIEFSEGTTCHGPRRFCSPKISKWRRLFWVILVVGSMALLCQQLYDRFNSFLQFEMKTAIRVDTKKQLELPAVTLCNINMFSLAHLTSMDTDLLDVAVNMSDVIAEFRNNLSTTAAEQYQCDNVPDDVFSKGHWRADYWSLVPSYEKQESEILAKYNVNNFTVDEWLKRIGWQLGYNKKRNYKAILECYVGAEECIDIAKFFSPVLTPLGVCYSMNSEQTKRRYQRRAGVGGGITLVVDVDEQNYSPYSLDQDWVFGSGLKIFINEWYETPNYGATAVGLPTGVMSYVSLTKSERQIENQPPWGHCQSFDETVKQPYSRRKCIARCRYKTTVGECGCRLWYEPAVENITQCGVVRTSACLIFKDLVGDHLVDEKCKSNCPDACSEATFDFGMSSTRLVSTHTLANLEDKWEFIMNSNTENENNSVNFTQAFFKDSMVMFEVGYSHLQVDVVRSSPSQGVSSFLAEIGGQLGLFAGISVITICELLEYPIMKIVKLIRRSSNKSENKHTKQEYPVTQNPLQPIFSTQSNGKRSSRKSKSETTPC